MSELPHPPQPPPPPPGKHQFFFFYYCVGFISETNSSRPLPPPRSSHLRALILRLVHTSSEL
jgi:hypothetical protein